MRKPTLKGTLSIIGAVLALILALIAALKDGALTEEEAADIGSKSQSLIHTIQVETAE